MAKAHVLALMGSDIKAHEELGKVHDVASRADTSYNPNCHEEGQGAFNAASTASFLRESRSRARVDATVLLSEACRRSRCPP